MIKLYNINNVVSRQEYISGVYTPKFVEHLISCLHRPELFTSYLQTFCVFLPCLIVVITFKNSIVYENMYQLNYSRRTSQNSNNTNNITNTNNNNVELMTVKIINTYTEQLLLYLIL